MLKVITPDSTRRHLSFTRRHVTAQLSKSTVRMLGGAHWLKSPTLPGTKVTTCILVRNTELISHHQPEEWGKGQKETPHVWPPPRILLAGLHLGWTRPSPPERTLSQWLAEGNPDTNPITIKPASHAAERSSWVPSPCRSPPGRPFPIKSRARSALVSPRTIHFRVRQEPSFGPWKGSPLLQNIYYFSRIYICSWTKGDKELPLYTVTSAFH